MEKKRSNERARESCCNCIVCSTFSLQQTTVEDNKRNNKQEMERTTKSKTTRIWILRFLKHAMTVTHTRHVNRCEETESMCVYAISVSLELNDKRTRWRAVKRIKRRRKKTVQTFRTSSKWKKYVFINISMNKRLTGNNNNSNGNGNRHHQRTTEQLGCAQDTVVRIRNNARIIITI